MKTTSLKNRRTLKLSRVSPLGLFLATALALGLPLTQARAFSLLGPFADWMDIEKDYRVPGEIGGPMNITEGYRWNIPVITYGFDRSFLNYFGSNGVVAVEEAITMLNDLPPASSIPLESYPTDVWRENFFSQSVYLLDLKTTALTCLLEQMGLADPMRNLFRIRDFGPDSSGQYYFIVIKRNFDPVTALPTGYLNDVLWSYYIIQTSQSPTPTNVFCYACPLDVAQSPSENPPAASFAGSFGSYVTGLSRDDVGGLRFLLSGEQAWWESLLPDVHLVNTNGGALVQAAVRPGIEKITFVRHPAGKLNGQFMPFTNRWMDIYYDYEYPAYQEVERVTTRPDILFSASDLGRTAVTRTGTSNWVNNAELNSASGGAGPGVIQPPVTIAFSSGGPPYIVFRPPGMDTNVSVSGRDAFLMFDWGSFTGETNPPLVYPANQVFYQPTQVHFRLGVGETQRDFQWPLSGRAFGRFHFQTTTNLANWSTLRTLTNSGAEFDYQFQAATNESARFFRAIPEQ